MLLFSIDIQKVDFPSVWILVSKFHLVLLRLLLFPRAFGLIPRFVQFGTFRLRSIIYAMDISGFNPYLLLFLKDIFVHRAAFLFRFPQLGLFPVLFDFLTRQ